MLSAEIHIDLNTGFLVDYEASGFYNQCHLCICLLHIPKGEKEKMK